MVDLPTHIVFNKSPAWLPEELRGKSFSFRFRYSPAERNVYRKRRKLPVSLWAERHRTITMGSLQGSWKNETTPYLAGIMDASFFPGVETVILCAADQVGKSECVNNCIGYAIDREPGPVLYVYPDEQTARENSRDRILPMIESSPRLRSYLTSQDDDAASFRISLQHMPIYMAWARSASRLANKPIKYIVFDETDKYPDTAGKREASPIRKGEKRLRTYRHSRKEWKLSTPTIESGPIWQALTQEAEAIFDFHVACPACGAMQRMVFGQIKWPAETRDPKKVELEDLAHYECIGCRAKWDDYLRNLAVQRGEWKARENGTRMNTERADQGEGQKEKRNGTQINTDEHGAESPSPRPSPAGGEGENRTKINKVEEKNGQELKEYLVTHQPKRIGFHLPSWLSRFVGLSEVAAAFLRGQGDKNELKDFLNSHAAEPWKDYTAERREDRILALRDDRPRGLTPPSEEIACLTAGVDTQDNGFWFEIRAWGFGLTLESWQVREGFVESFEALWQVLYEDRYADAKGKEHAVRLAVQDAMGHRTAEVYDFTRSHRGLIVPFKGEMRMARPHAYSNLEHYPGTGKPIPGGLKLLRADVNYYKNQLAGKFEVSAADPGAWHLHSETNEEWARHLCAEHIDDKTGLWVCPENRANHGWDCSVYNLVAAEVMGVKHWKKTEPRNPGASETKRKEGWMGKREGWIRRE